MCGSVTTGCALSVTRGYCVGPPQRNRSNIWCRLSIYSNLQGINLSRSEMMKHALAGCCCWKIQEGVGMSFLGSPWTSCKGVTFHCSLIAGSGCTSPITVRCFALHCMCASGRYMPAYCCYKLCCSASHRADPRRENSQPRRCSRA